MTRAVVLVLAVLACAIAPAGAIAAEHPPFDGTMSFPSIQDPTGPEEFSWEVQLHEGQELQAIDDRHAGVYSTEAGHLVFTIEAGAAHDADGSTVPTTLAVTQPNVITLTVHHRAGNPAAGGAPFVYPVVAGAGWEGGFKTHVVEMPPSESLPAAPPAPRCHAPDLAGRSLKAARKLLRRSNCKLGPVRGKRSRAAKVVRQYRKPGTSLPAGAEVGVKLG